MALMASRAEASRSDLFGFPLTMMARQGVKGWQRKLSHYVTVPSL